MTEATKLTIEQMREAAESNRMVDFDIGKRVTIVWPDAKNIGFTSTIEQIRGRVLHLKDDVNPTGWGSASSLYIHKEEKSDSLSFSKKKTIAKKKFEHDFQLGDLVKSTFSSNIGVAVALYPTCVTFLMPNDRRVYADAKKLKLLTCDHPKKQSIKDFSIGDKIQWREHIGTVVKVNQYQVWFVAQSLSKTKVFADKSNISWMKRLVDDHPVQQKEVKKLSHDFQVGNLVQSSYGVGVVTKIDVWSGKDTIWYKGTRSIMPIWVFPKQLKHIVCDHPKQKKKEESKMMTTFRVGKRYRLNKPDYELDGQIYLCRQASSQTYELWDKRAENRYVDAQGDLQKVGSYERFADNSSITSSDWEELVDHKIGDKFRVSHPSAATPNDFYVLIEIYNNWLKFQKPGASSHWGSYPRQDFRDKNNISLAEWSNSTKGDVMSWIEEELPAKKEKPTFEVGKRYEKIKDRAPKNVKDGVNPTYICTSRTANGKTTYALINEVGGDIAQRKWVDKMEKVSHSPFNCWKELPDKATFEVGKSYKVTQGSDTWFGCVYLCEKRGDKYSLKYQNTSNTRKGWQTDISEIGGSVPLECWEECPPFSKLKPPTKNICPKIDICPEPTYKFSVGDEIRHTEFNRTGKVDKVTTTSVRWRCHTSGIQYWSNPKNLKLKPKKKEKETPMITNDKFSIGNEVIHKKTKQIGRVINLGSMQPVTTIRVKYSNGIMSWEPLDNVELLSIHKKKPYPGDVIFPTAVKGDLRVRVYDGTKWIDQTNPCGEISKSTEKVTKLAEFSVKKEEEMMKETIAMAHNYVTSENLKRAEKIRYDLRARTEKNRLDLKAIRDGVKQPHEPAVKPKNPSRSYGADVVLLVLMGIIGLLLGMIL